MNDGINITHEYYEMEPFLRDNETLEIRDSEEQNLNRN